MHRKLICTIASVAMLAGVLFIGATPVQAAPPTDTKNFYPDDTPKANTSGVRLSDRFDGVDTTVHLTNVSTPDTTRVQWSLCASTTVAANGTETLTQAQFDSCTITIGEDSTPTTPVGDPPTGVDEAYEFNWNIPGSEDGATRDLVAAACIGAGEDVEGADANCNVDVENDVLLDDSQTATPQTSSGEIVSFCTSDVGGPGVGDDPCVVGGPGAGTPSEVAARFSPFGHGSNIPNDGFVMRIRTSEDITDPVGLLNIGDADTDPSTPFASAPACSNIFTGTNFKEWECVATDGEVPDDSELALTILRNFGGGTGNCDGTNFCEFDSHYVVSNDRRPTRAVAYFSPGTTSGDDTEAVNADSSCAAPDKEDTNRVGNSTGVNGCIFDQFGAGNKLDTSVTLESSGGEGFDSCEGFLHDHDGDGIFEHCHIDNMGADDEADASINSTVPDDQTVTFCFDAETGAAADPTNPAPTDHGCADESVTDSLLKHWIAGLPFEVTVVYAGSGQPGTNECFTGATFRENQVGDTDDLLACTFDQFGNEVNTSDADNGFLEWFIGAGNDDDVDTQFVGTPPSETGPDGHATATIEAVDPGSDSPGVQLRAEDGDFVDSDSVTKNVTPDGDEPSPSTVNIKHRTGPHRFKGRVRSPDDSCEPGRTVVVKRKRPGRDRTIGTDTTNANGKYTVRHKKTNKKKTYYARVRGNADCLGDRSRNIRAR